MQTWWLDNFEYQMSQYFMNFDIIYYCIDNLNLVCMNGFCICNSTSFWNSGTCVNKKKFGESCLSSDQCLTGTKLFCDLKTSLCSCSNDRWIRVKKFFFLIFFILLMSIGFGMEFHATQSVASTKAAIMLQIAFKINHLFY